jgi:hypothetical protein
MHIYFLGKKSFESDARPDMKDEPLAFVEHDGPDSRRTSRSKKRRNR